MLFRSSRATTISFMISTPETGVDSISVSYALLGPFFAIIRPFAAIFTAIYAGVMVKFFALEQNGLTNKLPNEADPSCCSSKQKQKETQLCIEKSLKSTKSEKTACCSINNKKVDASKPSFSQLVINSLKFSTGKLLSDITKWLLIGLFLAAAIKTWVSTDFLTQWGDGFMAMLVMAVIGIPMYICATASTPLAAGFLAAGLSPGAILVFMLAGPATNIATMGMIRQEMGARVLAAYLFSLFTASIGIGYLANWLINTFAFSIPTVAAHQHEMSSSIIYTLSAVLLASLMIKNWIKS